ncbi:protein-disulfide reductase DsbD domain-containing protein [Sulfitobacter sp. HNIBRBA3233]|uniref:protein-disulfide reductase DsbD domain-containing protein n=1 Tax=Sulfitobacter marinivivus TaxID=3158558 RepID=UPI0032DF105D
MMYPTLRLLPAALALGLSALFTPATAQDASGGPVTADLIEGWQMPDGSRIDALRLQLAPGWKTYWRAPGDAGIPPSFDWSGSRNLKAVSVLWPTPKVFDQNGMTSIGYTGQVILPLAVVTRGKGPAVDVNLTLDIGVCSDICVPERLELSGTLDSTGSKPVPAIAAALAERPFTAREAGARGVTCTLEPTDRGLKITATLSLPHSGGTEHVVIEAGRPDVWVSEAESSRSGNTLTATAEMIANGGGLLSLDRSAIRFTVLGKSHAVDLHGCTAG